MSYTNSSPRYVERLEKSLDNWIKKLILDRCLYDLEIPNNPDETKIRREGFDLNPSLYLKNHLFFITAHFRPNYFPARNAHCPYNSKRIFDEFRVPYLYLCRELIGPRFNKKLNQQPFMVAFLDVEGSRLGRPARVFQCPHIHALMLVRSAHLERFHAIRDGILQESRGRGLDKLDIVPFEEDIERLVTYVTKYARQQIRDDRISDLYEFFPNHLDWHSSLKKSIQRLASTFLLDNKEVHQ